MRTLIIIPTKNRIYSLNCVLTSLQYQNADFDIIIIDSSTDYNIIDNQMLVKQLEFLKNKGHRYLVLKDIGKNQLDALNIGLKYAEQYKYDLCFYGDDDILYEPDFFELGIKYMENYPDCGVLSGLTLNPWQTIEEQTPPSEIWEDEYYQGKLKNNSSYYHCISNHPTDDPIDCETLFAGFFFRTEDAVKVGGFPTYMSPSGNGGENILQTAILYSGKKLRLYPKMVSWHYYISEGGLRKSKEEREINTELDEKFFNYIRDRKKPSVLLTDEELEELLK